MNVDDSATPFLDQPLIENVSQNGITAFAGGSVRVNGGTVSGATINGICGCGGSAPVQGTTITAAVSQGSPPTAAR